MIIQSEIIVLFIIDHLSAFELITLASLLLTEFSVINQFIEVIVMMWLIVKGGNNSILQMKMPVVVIPLV